MSVCIAYIGMLFVSGFVLSFNDVPGSRPVYSVRMERVIFFVRALPRGARADLQAFRELEAFGRRCEKALE